RAAVHGSVLEQIRNKEFDALLEYDELQREIREGRGFYKFQEASITFAPTFKVIRNEVGKYNTKRLPAWCDRILWRSLPGCQLGCTRYDGAHDVGSSDHKPVLAEFELTTHALPVGLDPADASLVAEEGVVGAVARRLHRSASSRHGDMRWNVQFSSLVGSDLLSADANGLSDPYVRFTGPNLQHSCHTKPRYKTLNPVWTPEDIPSAVLENLSLQSHEKDYLLAAILDHDVTNQDDPIGFTAIPLAPAVHALRANNGSPFVDFQVEATRKGVPVGHLIPSAPCLAAFRVHSHPTGPSRACPKSQQWLALSGLSGFTAIALAPAVHALRANNGSPFVDFQVEATRKGTPAGQVYFDSTQNT
ncbi:unnamed protein product, partial [Closterium sp. Naga37s-1]